MKLFFALLCLQAAFAAKKKNQRRTRHSVKTSQVSQKEESSITPALPEPTVTEPSPIIINQTPVETIQAPQKEFEPTHVETIQASQKEFEPSLTISPEPNESSPNVNQTPEVTDDSDRAP